MLSNFCNNFNNLLIDVEIVSLWKQLIRNGVVQGSGIRPVMFLTYINELIYIPEEIGVKVELFDDDVKMNARIVNNVGMVQLQRTIDALTDWAREWQLGISVK